MKTWKLPVAMVPLFLAAALLVTVCDDDDDDSCDEQDEYFCTCTCYTPIGNVDRGHYVCACDSGEAWDKANDAQANSPCDYDYTCGSCERTGDSC